MSIGWLRLFILLIMKKILFFVVMLMSTSTCFAQFKASVNGVVVENGEDYYVVDIEGKNAQQLYDNVNAWIMSNFKNPDAVSSKENGKMLKLHGVFPDAVFIGNRLGFKDVADVDLELMMYFKDGKIRFDVPVVNRMKIHPKDSELFFSGARFTGTNMFKKDGSENKPKIIQSFNIFINGLIGTIVTEAKKTNDW